MRGCAGLPRRHEPLAVHHRRLCDHHRRNRRCGSLVLACNARGRARVRPAERPQMKPKHQRLVLLLLAVAAIIGAALLALSALQEQATSFYSPSDFASQGVEPGPALRLGGLVGPGSLGTEADGGPYNSLG